MKTIQMLVTMVVIAGIGQVGEAGLFDRMICRKAGKRCDCDCVPTCQPACCKPVIVAPCCKTVHTYQRSCSTLKPPCCNDCCAPSACCAPSCGDHACESAGACCCPSGQCGCGDAGCCDAGSCNGGCCSDTGCCDADCCDASSCDGCCPGTCCELAQLIYESQTACYARHRKRAIHRMSDRYDCVCHPEVMCALIYALNDADERVRTKAADEIGDQLRKNPCCCSCNVTNALTCALGDCHWAVRWQAKQALKRCGYVVVKARKMGCCDLGCCDTTCCSSGCGDQGGSAASMPTAVPSDLPPGEVTSPTPAPAPAPVPHPEAGTPILQDGAPAPEPPSAYFQKPLIRQTSGTKSRAKKGLSALLELFD